MKTEKIYLLIQIPIYDENLGASFKEAIVNDTSVANEGMHDNDETSGNEAEEQFNIVVKEDKIHCNLETIDGGITKDNDKVYMRITKTFMRT